MSGVHKHKIDNVATSHTQHQECHMFTHKMDNVIGSHIVEC